MLGTKAMAQLVDGQLSKPGNTNHIMVSQRATKTQIGDPAWNDHHQDPIRGYGAKLMKKRTFEDNSKTALTSFSM